MPRAQVSLFILVGIILLLVIFLLVFALKPKESVVIPDVKRSGINSLVLGCLEQSGMKAAYSVSLGGGYLNPLGMPEFRELGDGLPHKIHYFTEFGVVPYAASLTPSGVEKSLPELFEIEQKIGSFVLGSVGGCLENKSVDGFLLSYPDEKRSVEVNVRDDNVVVKLFYPVELVRQDNVVRVDEFVSVIPLRLKLLHARAKELVDSVKSMELDLLPFCSEWLVDPPVNVYVNSGRIRREALVSFVDIAPLDYGFVPLKFRIAVKNVRIKGECVG